MKASATALYQPYAVLLALHTLLASPLGQNATVTALLALHSLSRLSPTTDAPTTADQARLSNVMDGGTSQMSNEKGVEAQVRR